MRNISLVGALELDASVKGMIASAAQPPALPSACCRACPWYMQPRSAAGARQSSQPAGAWAGKRDGTNT